jgi:prepilin-type N-terminal cleavage/methylation domain-containing protein
VSQVPARRVTCDAGFTLIELLVTVVILSVITVPLGNFMLQYLKNYTTTSDRLNDSHDIQIATAYFGQDVANIGVHASTAPYDFAQSVWTTGFPGTYCGQGAGATVVLMTWDAWTVGSSAGQTTGSNDPSSVAYVKQGTTLHRIYCASGTAVSSDVTVVHNLQSATVACASPTTCENATPPTTVKLTLGITTGSTDQAAPDPVTLTGQRRQS